jgi:hypothetical protein
MLDLIPRFYDVSAGRIYPEYRGREERRAGSFRVTFEVVNDNV